MSSFLIEPAHDVALPAAFALLPMLASADATLFVARDADGTLAGAGGMIWRAWGQPAGFPAWVHVLPDRRGRGIGRALVERLAQEAAGETHGLMAAQPITRGSDAAGFAAAIGAQEIQGHHYFEMRTPAFHQSMTRLVNRMRDHGQLPADARVEPLDAGNAIGVAELVAAHFNVLPPAAEAAVQRALVETPAPGLIDRERTCVIRVGDAVAGVLVAKRNAEGAGTDIMFRIVAAGFRGGWINPFLMERFLTRLCPDGQDEIVTFDCIDSNKDTLRLATRTAARTVRIDGIWRYAVASEPAA